MLNFNNISIIYVYYMYMYIYTVLENIYFILYKLTEEIDT